MYEEVQELLKKTNEIAYPEIGFIRRNSYYADLLYDDLAGEMGELSAITQYVYEHIDLSLQQDISRILLQIAIEEMKHLNLVGSIMKKLGKKPYYINTKGEVWSSNNVKYDTGNLKETMKYNIETEKVAIQGYQKAIQYTNQMNIRRIFQRIILDEQNHIKIFQTVLKYLT